MRGKAHLSCLDRPRFSWVFSSDTALKDRDGGVVVDTEKEGDGEPLFSG